MLSINPKLTNLIDNKTFWKKIQSIFGEKYRIANKIVFPDYDENIIFAKKLVSEELTIFFFFKMFLKFSA